jgi:hypothetical protein
VISESKIRPTAFLSELDTGWHSKQACAVCETYAVENASKQKHRAWVLIRAEPKSGISRRPEATNRSMGTNKFACLVPMVREYWPDKAEERVKRITGAVGVAAFSAAPVGI